MGSPADSAQPAPDDVTLILQQASRGDDDAASALFPLVYDELRSLASGYFRRERSDHTLQPTALVHEAYLKLIKSGDDAPGFNSRAHFFAVAATAMRHILVNHAKARGREKRGGDRQRVEFDENLADSASIDNIIDLVALDDAMTRLAEFDAQKARVVELRFFGGMTIEEAGEVMNVSPRTVRRDWTFAKAWLRGELTPESESPGNKIGDSP